jgi:transposase
LRQRLQTQQQDYEQRLAEARAQIAELQRQLFGPKADRLTQEQEEQLKRLLEDAEAAAEQLEAESSSVLRDEADSSDSEKGRKTKSGKRQRRHRHPLPENMETETVILEPELKPCACCQQMPVKIGEEVSEEIDLIPARLIRRRTVRPKYACRCGEAGVAIAPLPPRLIPQSRLGLGLAAHIVLARYDDHLSFYWLEQQFRERYGVVIPRQQIGQWVEHIATHLRPIYEGMWQAMLAGGYLQVDETPVKVLDPEVKRKAARGYLWFYAVPGGDVVLEFDRSRGQDPVRRRLLDFTGTIQTDAYEVYLAVKRQQPTIERIGCLAHARRHIYQAVRENLVEAVWFITRIRQLYRIEDRLRRLPAAERHARRLIEAPEIWSAMKTRAEELTPQLLPKSTLGKALHYFLNEYDALTGYLRNGRLEIDNNLIENSIRPTVVGRKRWLFLGHPEAAWRSAVIYSVLISCRRRGINTLDYLTDVLHQAPGLKTNQFAHLLPGNWKPQARSPG